MLFFVYAYWHDHRFKNKVGGPIKVWELTDNLTSMGHTVFLFVPKIGFPELQTSANIQAVPFIDFPVVRFLSFQLLSFILSLVLVARNGKPDIIYVRIMLSFIPMLLGKLFRVPVILEVNDSPHRAYAGIKFNFKKKIAHLIHKISYRLCDHILPVTEKIAKDLQSVDDIPCDSMTVLPSGTNTELFRPLVKSSCHEKIGFDPTKVYVGFIGTFFQYQGIDILIDSAPSIIREFSDARFLLVGDGPMRATWERKSVKNGLSPYFIFTGLVPYKDIPLYCGIMDVCVSPLLNEARESSAVKIFDYLACGKPVVISDIEGTGRHFLASEAVILVKPEDPSEL